MMKTRTLQLFGLAATSLFATSAMAGGFEKGVTWSGEHSGMGNAAVSLADSSEALYFNPAGLAFVEGTGDISANFSPTYGKFEGPFLTGQSNGTIPTIEQNDSERSMSPVFGVTSAYRVNEKLALGLGAFVSGGSKAIYNVNYLSNEPNFTLTPQQKTSLSNLEVSLGVAYAISSKFAIGAAWRFTSASAAISSNVITSASAGTVDQVYEIGADNLKATDAAGFRAGLVYRDDSFGLGINFRSEVELETEGDLIAQSNTIAQTSPVTLTGHGAVATMGATFPLQVEVGGHYNFSDSTVVALVYGYSQYSANDELVLASSGLLTSIGQASSVTELNWLDQHHIRLGVQHQAGKYPIRLGYVINTNVTPEGFAAPQFSSPGPGHSFTVGSGYAFEKFDVNATFEYAFAANDDVVSANGAFGDYKSNAFVFHAGLKYPF